jgi:hypothetical protein
MRRLGKQPPKCNKLRNQMHIFLHLRGDMPIKARRWAAITPEQTELQLIAQVVKAWCVFPKNTNIRNLFKNISYFFKDLQHPTYRSRYSSLLTSENYYFLQRRQETEEVTATTRRQQQRHQQQQQHHQRQVSNPFESSPDG